MKTMLIAIEVDEDTAERLATVGAKVDVGEFTHEHVDVIATATVEDARDKMFLRSPLAKLTDESGTVVETFQSGLTLVSNVEGESLETQAILNLAPVLEVLAGVSIGYRS